MILLFIFFALPIATILLAIVLQKVLKCPILVAITFFAIYLIVSFVAFSDSLAEALIATIIYTAIAFITAYLVRVIGRLIERLNSTNTNNCGCDNDDLPSCGCGCNNDDSYCNCGSSEINLQNRNVAFNANIIPNTNNAGTTGFIRGRYRRF